MACQIPLIPRCGYAYRHRGGRDLTDLDGRHMLWSVTVCLRVRVRVVIWYHLA